jgi:hypothetical protein
MSAADSSIVRHRKRRVRVSCTSAGAKAVVQPMIHADTTDVAATPRLKPEQQPINVKAIA